MVFRSTPAPRIRSARLLALVAGLTIAGSAAAAGRPPLRLDAGPTGDLLVYSPSRGVWYNCLFDPDPSSPGRFTYAGGAWGPNWTVLPARLTDDGLVDVFLYNTRSGEWAWKINSGTGYTDGPTGLWSPGWTLSVADFNGDGLDDIFVFNRSTGHWYQCLNKGAGATPPFDYVPGAAWPTGRDLVVGDFNGDGKGDIFTYDPVTGAWTEHLADAATGVGFPSTRTGNWSPGWQVFTGSLDGDALTDLFVYNPLNGRWFQCFSTADATAFRSAGGVWSKDWQIHPADLNGDGRDDIFVYNAQNGSWYVCLKSASGDGFADYIPGMWSSGWDVHVTDFDDDGRDDLFVYKMGSGVFFQCLNVADGQFAYRGGRWDPGWLLASVVGDRLDAPPLPPAVLSITPSSGLTDGGTPVVITGASFQVGATVTIGGVAATSVTVLGPTSIAATTGPRPAGTVDVTVTNADRLSSTLAGGFSYVRPTPPPPPPPPPTIPFLTTTDILAFGDSITEGVTSALMEDKWLDSFVTTGYPQRLQALLQARYTGEIIVVTNAGVGGERAADGRARLPGEMTADQDLVILLEGVNDLNVAVTPEDVAVSLAEMIRTAKAAGKKVVLCTLTPTMPMQPSRLWKGAEIKQVVALNALLPALASAEGVPLADLFAAFGPDDAHYAQFLSPDGLHPNDAGYQRIAETIADVIVANFQVFR